MKPARIRDEEQPWNAPIASVLKAAGKTQNWLIVRDEDVAALAEGVVTSSVRVQATRLAESIGKI